MTDSKHTPGPWTVERRGGRPTIIGSDRSTVAGSPKAKDARLIALAPEMLEALGRALEVFQRESECWSSPEEIDELDDDISALIARARGEEAPDSEPCSACGGDGEGCYLCEGTGSEAAS
jgi:hypothetical protein